VAAALAARSEFEMLSRRAEGLRQIVDACGGADAAYRMLMIEHIPTLADKAAAAISTIKFDKVVLWGGTGANGAAGAGVSQFVQDIVSSLPPALHTMLNIGGVSVADQVFRIEDDEAATGEPARKAARRSPAPPAGAVPATVEKKGDSTTVKLPK
jgi:flotillin